MEVGDANVAWAEVTSEEWAQAIRQGMRKSVDGDDDVFEWTCPRCGHQASNRFPRDEIVEAVSGAPMVTLTCGCGVEHADQPAGETGCGCYGIAVVESPG